MLDFNGKDIIILGEEFGDIVWNKWVSLYFFEGIKVLGMLVFYLISLEKFFVFVMFDKYKRKEMLLLYGNDLDVFKGIINVLKGWCVIIDNEIQDVQYWIYFRECDIFLMEIDINFFF